MFLLICLSAAESTHAAGSRSYALSVGKKDAKRLQAQHDFLREVSTAQLRRAGLRKGQIVCDMGCGVGVMTEYLAEIVGPEGRVYACDNSPEQLEEAKERIEKAGLHDRVTFLLCDACDASCFTGLQRKFDLVYARFFLMHVRDPQQAITIMQSLLKPGGVVVSAEPSHRTMYFKPDAPVLREIIAKSIAFGKSIGADYNIGDRSSALCKNAGLQVVDSIVESQLPFPIGFKNMQIWFPKAIAAGFITQKQAEEWRKQIKKYQNQGGTLYGAKLTYLIAKKGSV